MQIKGVSSLNYIVYDQNFFWGEGMVDGEGGSSERCLKWGGGGWGSLRDLSKNFLKQGVGKGKSCSQGGGGFEGVTTPAPPENFNHTHTINTPLQCGN